MLEIIKQCRACGHHNLEPILSLGEVPLANALLSRAQLEKSEQKFPLSLVFCNECTLVQIKETVDPQVLFANYFYFSSFSDTMLKHAKQIVDKLVVTRQLNAKSLVLEIASNDGYLLQYYKQQGIPVLGIEPAANIAKVATEERGIPTLVEFFNENLAKKLAHEGHYADVIHANNVFAHVPNPNLFVAGLKIILKPDGVAVIEAPYLVDFIEKTEFDTIYHEHFSYYSLTAIQHLMKRHGLKVGDVEHVGIHGGTLRYYITHENNVSQSQAVQAMLDHEKTLGIAQFSFYQAFADKVMQLRNSLLELLIQLKQKGKTIAAYGASAKGSTLLNAFNIGQPFLDFVVDRSTVKQGHFTPGGRLPILSPNALLEKKPDYVLLLTWNFKEEIFEQQSAYRALGGKFIVPIPEVQVV